MILLPQTINSSLCIWFCFIYILFRKLHQGEKCARRIIEGRPVTRGQNEGKFFHEESSLSTTYTKSRCFLFVMTMTNKLEIHFLKISLSESNNFFIWVYLKQMYPFYKCLQLRLMFHTAINFTLTT